MTRRLTLSRDLIRELTVGELELLEERTGRPLSKLFDADAPRGPLLHSLAYIALRRDEPELTWEDAADVVVELREGDDEEVEGRTGPTPAGRARRPG